mmetsp:Transcript_17804/g.42192  ORF Transcript_17804/g.42192 Transcript_17804/m.42192 type:complete len:290 (-) Transcript_17804:26-895(-)
MRAALSGSRRKASWRACACAPPAGPVAGSVPRRSPSTPQTSSWCRSTLSIPWCSSFPTWRGRRSSPSRCASHRMTSTARPCSSRCCRSCCASCCAAASPPRWARCSLPTPASRSTSPASRRCRRDAWCCRQMPRRRRPTAPCVRCRACVCAPSCVYRAAGGRSSRLISTRPSSSRPSRVSAPRSSSVCPSCAARPSPYPSRSASARSSSTTAASPLRGWSTSSRSITPTSPPPCKTYKTLPRTHRRPCPPSRGWWTCVARRAAGRSSGGLRLSESESRRTSVHARVSTP